MATCKCRYDAAGHKILPHADMLLYYKGDQKSLDIVRSQMPHRYICIPTIEIHIHKGDQFPIRVYRIYPGETMETERFLTLRALKGLRSTYREKSRWEHPSRPGEWCILRLPGRVVLDPLQRYGIRR